MMKFDDLKQSVQDQYKRREIKDDLGQTITVKSWKRTNAHFRDQLRAKGVKFRSVFFNPNDNRVYIKQTFRNVKVGGLPQIENTYEDVLCFILDGEEKHLNGYWDDEYISIHFIEIRKKCI